MGSSPMFPNIFYNYSYNYLINHINLNTAKKSLHFEIRFTQKNLPLLRLLKNLGVICSYHIIKSNSLKIKINLHFFKKLPICKNIKLISTPSRHFFVSLQALNLLHNRTKDSLFILSTNLGLMTHAEAIRKKLGGKVLMLITL